MKSDQTWIPCCAPLVADVEGLEMYDRGRGRWIALADIVVARRPRVGALWFYTLIGRRIQPTISEVIGKGRGQRIGEYYSAADRAALLRTVREERRINDRIEEENENGDPSLS